VDKRFLTKQPGPSPFSHGVVITRPEKFIILSFDRHGPGRQLVGGGDLAAQTRQVFENIVTPGKLDLRAGPADRRES
jgi:hypothetical protein